VGTLLHSCAEVHELIGLSFGVASVVVPGIGVLDGGQHAVRERGVWEVLGSFLPINLNGVLFNSNVLEACLKS